MPQHPHRDARTFARAQAHARAHARALTYVRAQIQLDKADVVFCGSGEAEDWGFSVMFDSMTALSTKRVRPHGLCPSHSAKL
eukprot:3004410-Pleurochrysis_carterae.AAC.1